MLGCRHDGPDIPKVATQVFDSLLDLFKKKQQNHTLLAVKSLCSLFNTPLLQNRNNLYKTKWHYEFQSEFG